MAASAKSDNQTDGDTLDKAGLENFPVAPFFLPAAWRADLMAVYGFARLIDDAGDGDLAHPAEVARLLGVKVPVAPPAPPGPPTEAEAEFRLALLDGLERDLDRAFGNGTEPPRHPLMRALVPLVDKHALTPEPFRRLIEANRVDQTTARYATYRDLIGYCTLSADPVGRLVLSIAGSPPRSGSRTRTRSAARSRWSSTSRTLPRTSAEAGSTSRPRTWSASASPRPTWPRPPRAPGCGSWWPSRSTGPGPCSIMARRW